MVFGGVARVFVKGCGYVRGTDGVVCLGAGCAVGCRYVCEGVEEGVGEQV